MSIFLLLFFFFFFFFCKMLVAILLGMHASAYFIFGIFISILIFSPWFMPCYLKKMHIQIYFFFFFCLCYMGLKLCGNLNAKNKMQDIGKGTYHLCMNFWFFCRLCLKRRVPEETGGRPLFMLHPMGTLLLMMRLFLLVSMRLEFCRAILTEGVTTLGPPIQETAFSRDN